MTEEKKDTQLEIMMLLLNEGSDFSIRAIGKRLGMSSSLVFYHIKKLAKKGVLVKEEKNGDAYYVPQEIFTKDAEETIGNLEKLADLIDEPTDEKIATCVSMFLKCYDVL